MTYTTADIRNVCLLGPGRSGKTQLTEALLSAGGAIASPGLVEQKNTVSDFDERERELEHSLYTSVCHLSHEGIQVNLIDTPGHRDFFGRALSVLAAVDTAAIVIDAHAGIDEMTHRAMEAASEQGLCRMLIVNKIDEEDVDLGAILDEIQSAFGRECLPINLPSAEGGGVVDCFFQPNGAATAFGEVESAHTQIVDQVVEVDEELMELYLEHGDDLNPEQLHAPFEKALREGHLVPVCFASASTSAGIPELLNVFERLMPNPDEGNPPSFYKGEGEDAEQVTVSSDPNEHVIAHVVKVNIDPFKGRLGIFRIHQGTIRTGSQLYIGDSRKPIKVNQLLKLNGDQHTNLKASVPGDICAIPRVDEAYFGAVLHDSHDEDNFHLKSFNLPPPMYGLAVSPSNDADVQKISDALHIAVAEDPSLQLEHITTLNEVVLRGLGELHLRTVLEGIEQHYDLKVKTSLPSIAYKETITRKADGHHRHKKQSGGAGQFGEVFLSTEPLPAGSGFEFVSKIVGGAIPSQFIPAVETGVRQVLGNGAISGYPLQDVRVTVLDGKFHAVDSKEIAFVQAGKKAFINAIGKASPIIMEPIVKVAFTVPSDCVGSVTGDLASMRGSISGTEILTDNRSKISGLAPLKELQAYHSRLKSLSGGEGVYTADFSHYARVPGTTQKELVSAFQSPDGD
ncbi:MAG: elongation factor G [Gammaproteobacteria bacterium]|jgi:elongation factor G|nr:elongation factor G [Gammaproteobacteria bacterium]HJO12506.1 elongation factor G [Gammaproteobacteria bacterium]|tara:strand:+ start:1452 stop:3497 length:2046 start_codon:yes stop_codon:yes gene_type:complete